MFSLRKTFEENQKTRKNPQKNHERVALSTAFTRSSRSSAWAQSIFLKLFAIFCLFWSIYDIIFKSIYPKNQ